MSTTKTENKACEQEEVKSSLSCSASLSELSKTEQKAPSGVR